MAIKKWLSVLAAGMSLLAASAYANLVINISQGVDRPYPIAVVPFANDLTLKSLPKGMAGVISNDLEMSGKFTLLARASMPNTPSAPEGIDWSVWNKAATGVEYMVVGKLQRSGDSYTVSFALMSILGGQPLIAQKYTAISASQLRPLAHHISDMIYQNLTGIPGVFSTRIAYVSVLHGDSKQPTYRLVVADADGFNPQVLFSQRNNPLASPTWSPDGKTLAYVSYHKNRMVVVGMNVATGARKILSGYPGMNSAPAFSPDGKKLALALSMGAGTQTNIYILDLVSGKLQQYTKSANNTSPHFAPDGNSLVFNSDRSGQPQIYQLDLNSKSVNRISASGIKNFSPVFTPNGKTLVMMHQESGSSAIQLATLDLATGTVTVITHGNLDKSPSVAPNGAMVIYANYDQLNGRLVQTPLNGKIQVDVPAVSGSAQSPAWSPMNF